MAVLTCEDTGLIDTRLTLWNWDNEKDSQDCFEDIIRDTECFDLWREVESKSIDYLPHWRNPVSFCRPDFIIKPTQKLIDAGWMCDGWIIVECKKSKTPIGPMISQASDYMRCTYQINGVSFRPSWAFLWPVAEQSDAIASFMCHQRIGTVHVSSMLGKRTENLLKFHCGQARLASIGRQRIETLSESFNVGKKTGSR